MLMFRRLKMAVRLNYYYTRGIMPKHVTSGVVHHPGLAPRQHTNVAAVTSRWRHCDRFDRPRNRTYGPYDPKKYDEDEESFLFWIISVSSHEFTLDT